MITELALAIGYSVIGAAIVFAAVLAADEIRDRWRRLPRWNEVRK